MDLLIPFCGPSFTPYSRKGTVTELFQRFCSWIGFTLSKNTTVYRVLHVCRLPFFIYYILIYSFIICNHISQELKCRDLIHCNVVPVPHNAKRFVILTFLLIYYHYLNFVGVDFHLQLLTICIQ